MSGPYRPTRAVVDLDALRHNIRAVMPDDADLMAVVKADAYGHGDVACARAALEAGATWIGVALVEEGLVLREAGIDAPILCLSEFPPGAEADALAGSLTPTVYSQGGFDRLLAAAADPGVTLGGVHVKVDTGMHRVGMAPDEIPAFVEHIRGAGLTVAGLWTHLARAEDDAELTKKQLERFLEVVDAVRALGVEPKLHAANSAATMLYPETHLDIVRPGIAIYGLAANPALASSAGLKPALTWKSAVSFAKRLAAGESVSYGQTHTLERDAWIATVPVGYEDGYSRRLSNRADVLIGGKRRRVVGNVTMDQILVDCGDDEIAVGDEVVLLGAQGDERVSAEELAEINGTVHYEVLCAISERVPREYVG
ncbi:MAG: alanine racemase [Actinomycetota bacterium]